MGLVSDYQWTASVTIKTGYFVTEDYSLLARLQTLNLLRFLKNNPHVCMYMYVHKHTINISCASYKIIILAFLCHLDLSSNME